MNVTLLKIRSAAILALAILSGINAQAEGTKQLSPNSSSITALTLIPDRNSGSYLGAPDANRLNFYISSVDEYVFCGFRWKEYVGSGTPNDVNMYYRLYNGSHVLVGTGLLPTIGTAGYIQNYTQAFNGPNGVDGVTNGYTPLSFRIGDLGSNYGTGEYSMEFYRSTNGGATATASSVWSIAPYFDFTVARKEGNDYTSIPGRVFCRKWGFAAVNSSHQVTASANSVPAFYSYSDDQTIIKISFNDVFRPIAYDLAVNFYGVIKSSPTANFDVDRRSINSITSPDIPDGYRLFLNSPDRNAFPIKPITVQPALANPPVTGCGTNLKINFNMPAPGDARILIDLNGTDDYQAGTEDVLLEIFNAPAGQGAVAWDGKNGLGTTVANTAVMKVSAVYERGRFSIPLYDAEINKYGFKVESIEPIQSTTIPLYWDDSRLANVTGQADNNQNNSTGAGLNNSLKGQPSPAHAWNGNGNTNMTIPAPSVNNPGNNNGTNETDGVQYNDFGNVRVINTWGWALQAKSPVAQIKFGCFPVSGNVYHDANGLSDLLVNKTNNVAIPSGLYANIISKDTYTDNDGIIHTLETVIGVAPVSTANGTYTISNVPNGNYYIVLSTTQGTIGSNTIPATALPANSAGNWANAGEYLVGSTAAGNDGIIDGKLSLSVSDGAVINANFGIEQRPVSAAKTAAIQGNPGGANKVKVITLTGTDPEEGIYTGLTRTDKIVINTLPANGVLYYSGIAVSAGQVISNYDSSLLSVNPVEGNTIVSFTYSHIDAAGNASNAPATVSMEFKVITVTGNVWDDGNGNLTKESAEPMVSGNNTSGTLLVPGGANLYVNMINSAGRIIQTTPVAPAGTYTFDKAPYNANGLFLQLSTVAGIIDSNAGANTMAGNWTYTGQSIGASNTASQTSGPGFINLNTGTATISAQNFAINRAPVSTSINVPEQSNPGGNNRITVPALSGTDGEDGSYGTGSKIIIKTLPSSSTGILYYNGTPVTAGQLISGYDPLLLTIDPANGNVTPAFTYTHVDAAGQEAKTPATVSLPFKVIEVNGYVWDDANNSITKETSEKYVSGTNAASGSVSVAAGDVLYANLLDANNKVIQAVQVSATGTYILTNTPLNTSGLKIQLTKTPGIEAAAIPATALPNAWVYTGEITTGNTAVQTTATDGIILLTTTAGNLGNQNFGIEKKPASDAKTVAVQGNPGGSNKVTVPALTGSDLEDGTYNGTSLTNTIVINTIPTTAMGILYYNGSPVVAGTPITSYDPAKLTFDPADGNITMTFTYSNVDAAGKPSVDPAQVKMDFGVISVSGNIWDDANSNKVIEGTEKYVSGNNTASATTNAAGTTLYMNLVNAAGKVIQTVQVSATGAYTFDKVPQATTGLKIQLSTVPGNVDAAQPATTMPADWIATGQNVNASNTAAQITGLSIIDLNAGTSPISAQNFGIEKKPASDPKTVAQGNLGGTIKVAVPTLTGSDLEDGTYYGSTSTDMVIINTIPATATGILYYNGIAVTAGLQINNYDPGKLTVDPVDGNVTVIFTYSHLDAGGKTSVAPAQVKIDFSVITVSGNVWDDANSNSTFESTEKYVSGDNTTSTTANAAGASLYANLINAAGKVIQSVQVSATGAYSFDKAPSATTGLKIQLSTIQGVAEANQPATTLPADWVATGQNINASNTAVQTTGLSIIDLTTGTGASTAQNFGMEKKPASDAKTAALQGNPGGINKVVVPTLTGSDLEDGTYNGTSLTNTIVINTLPTTAMGILYYNGSPAVAGIPITNYDPSKLTIDPADSTVTASFTYSHIDAGTKTAIAPATVTMSFGVITVSGNIWEDKNNNKTRESNELFISGNNTSSATTTAAGTSIYVNLINATGKVIQSAQVAANGSYNLTKVPQSVTGLKIQLSTIQGSVDANQPATTVPGNWVATGQSIGAGNNAAQTTGLSIIDLTTTTGSITAQNFGLKQPGFCFVGRMYIEGALMNNGNAIANGRPLMRDDLRKSPYTGLNYIPAKDPYEFSATLFDFRSAYTKKTPQTSHVEFQHVTDSATVFSVTGQNAIVDWVFVELRDKANSANVIATRAGLLQRDGDIVDVDGVSCLFFTDVPADNYFVSVRHRSHLGIMTRVAQTPEQMTTLVDFTSLLTPLYDKGTSGPGNFNYTGLATNNTVKTGYRALWAGDFDGNAKVKFDSPNDDLKILLNEVGFYPTNYDLLSNYDFAYGYFQGDFNMNSKAKFDSPNDDQVYLLNAVGFYPNNLDLLSNFDFFLQQLP